MVPASISGACCASEIQVIPESGGFDAEEVIRLLARWPKVSMFAAPTMINQSLTVRSNAMRSIRTIVSGGAPMQQRMSKGRLIVSGGFAQIYGQGESPMTISCLSKQDLADREHPKWDRRLRSVGRPFSCVEVVVANSNGSSCSPEESGEILCRGDVVMAGYWENDEATAAVLKDGWLHTGDIGTLIKPAISFLRDRSKDLIISGGSNIYPREVEEVLLQHPGVLEASVIGRPDPEWGEIVIAYVVGTASRRTR